MEVLEHIFSAHFLSSTHVDHVQSNVLRILTVIGDAHSTNTHRKHVRVVHLFTHIYASTFLTKQISLLVIQILFFIGFLGCLLQSKPLRSLFHFQFLLFAEHIDARCKRTQGCFWTVQCLHIRTIGRSVFSNINCNMLYNTSQDQSVFVTFEFELLTSSSSTGTISTSDSSSIACECAKYTLKLLEISLEEVSEYDVLYEQCGHSMNLKDSSSI